jgi:hypothetical protein
VSEEIFSGDESELIVLVPPAEPVDRAVRLVEASPTATGTATGRRPTTG